MRTVGRNGGTTARSEAERIASRRPRRNHSDGTGYEPAVAEISRPVTARAAFSLRDSMSAIWGWGVLMRIYVGHFRNIPVRNVSFTREKVVPAAISPRPVQHHIRRIDAACDAARWSR